MRVTVDTVKAAAFLGNPPRLLLCLLSTHNMLATAGLAGAHLPSMRLENGLHRACLPNSKTACWQFQNEEPNLT